MSVIQIPLHKVLFRQILFIFQVTRSFIFWHCWSREARFAPFENSLQQILKQKNGNWLLEPELPRKWQAKLKKPVFVPVVIKM